MNFIRHSVPSHGSHLTSKFVDIYGKLFRAISPKQIAPQQDSDRFFSDLLDLKVDRPYLEGELNRIPKDICLGRLKVCYNIRYLDAHLLILGLVYILVAIPEYTLSGLSETYSFGKIWRYQEVPVN